MVAGLVFAAQPFCAEEAVTESLAEEEAVTEGYSEEVSGADAVSAADNQKLDASYTLALNAINSEDYETAKEYLNICFAYCDPQSNPVMYADLLLKQACIDVIEEKLDMALIALDAAIRIRPDLADAYLVRTQVFAGQGNTEQAIVNLEKYIELTEDTSLYETIAQLHEANGDLDAAQEAYDKYVQGAGTDAQDAVFQSALYKMEAGKLEEAIADFETYAEDETYGAGAMYNIGVCQMSLGDYQAAVDAFTACEDKGGTFEGLYYNRGVCSLLLGAWEDAGADFKTSVEGEPYVDDARYNLGICQMQMEEYENAVATFTELIGDGGPEEAEAVTEGGGDAAEAVTEAEETADDASQEHAVNDGAYYYRAMCRGAIGELEGAIADYTVCIDHGYELASTYYQRAQVYAALGDTENQTSDLENSLKYAE